MKSLLLDQKDIRVQIMRNQNKPPQDKVTTSDTLAVQQIFPN